MKICITRSEKYAYSETFIRDQISGFSEVCDVFTIHSGRYPEKKENGDLLSPTFYWAIHKIVKGILGRNNYFSNYGVVKFLKNSHIDVVLANYGMSASHMVPPCKINKTPLIVIFHGHDATDKKILRRYKTKYTSLFTYASHIVSVSEDMKQKLLEMGANPKKVHVIPCGVKTSKFDVSTEVVKTKSFLAVGRLTPKKGPLYTILAFHKVLQKYPDAKLTFVGNKNGLFEDCQKLITELQIPNSIFFTGILNQNKISDLMKSSLAFVQHSITAPNGDMEGTPVSIMEAASSGLPVVSTKHGGIKELVIHEETGYLVDETDEQGMANYMMKLCENPELAKAMGIKGRQHIERKYDQKKQLDKLCQLARELVKPNTEAQT
ncbi:glycosyltransferase [Flagellimonas onchidii]|uniref:glycosyltransferase n=1 Tax=Flagellimonas onchidii TaxID=2562684 RepID=UPI0010A5FEBC|nr:glycosyltransferase [Allomuricauda onchidii]